MQDKLLGIRNRQTLFPNSWIVWDAIVLWPPGSPDRTYFDLVLGLRKENVPYWGTQNSILFEERVSTAITSVKHVAGNQVACWCLRINKLMELTLEPTKLRDETVSLSLLQGFNCIFVWNGFEMSPVQSPRLVLTLILINWLWLSNYHQVNSN